MSAITSQAIVITAYPGNHGRINMQASDYSLIDTADFDSDDSNCSGAPKKRRRLTHLSPDEKLLRRKLKNRVAAQTARDRKKALMVELEEKVALLEEENKALKRQNYSLKEASNTLVKENSELKSRLSESTQSTVKTEPETLRSAAPAVPLQKEQVQILSRLMAQYIVFVMITLSLMVSSTCGKSSETAQSVSGRKRKQPRPIRRISVEEEEEKTSKQTTALHLEWWGSHQQSWNPSMN